MKAYKEHQYLIFKFDDGKDVKYNLATGDTIGKSGKPVKDICTQLSGYDLLGVINSFEDKNYSKFLDYLDKNFINKSMAVRYNWRNHRVDRIRNIGSFLKRIQDYSIFEKYFASGIYKVDPSIKYDLNEIPKGLLKLCREYNLSLDNQIVESYKENHALYNNLLALELISLPKYEVFSYLYKEKYYTGWRQREYQNHFYELVELYNYNPRLLVTYIDNLMTYEALGSDVIREIVDYAKMMSQISPKYDKYPKNFLTTHRIASRNYNRLKTEFDEKNFEKQIKKEMEFTYDNYKVIYPESTQAIKDEAVQQNHCVASYIDRVIDGECDILFLRSKEDLEHSLVTIEVRNNKVVQARGKFNRETYKNEQEVIDRYNKYLLKIS